MYTVQIVQVLLLDVHSGHQLHVLLVLQQLNLTNMKFSDIRLHHENTNITAL